VALVTASSTGRFGLVPSVTTWTGVPDGIIDRTSDALGGRSAWPSETTTMARAPSPGASAAPAANPAPSEDSPPNGIAAAAARAIKYTPGWLIGVRGRCVVASSPAESTATPSFGDMRSTSRRTVARAVSAASIERSTTRVRFTGARKRLRSMSASCPSAHRAATASRTTWSASVIGGWNSWPQALEDGRDVRVDEEAVESAGGGGQPDLSKGLADIEEDHRTVSGAHGLLLRRSGR
jgi:hypothetical protein